MLAKQKQLQCTLELGRKETKARRRGESGEVGVARVERIASCGQHSTFLEHSIFFFFFKIMQHLFFFLKFFLLISFWLCWVFFAT